MKGGLYIMKSVKIFRVSPVAGINKIDVKASERCHD